MSANTVSETKPSALLRRIQSLCQSASDLALDNMRTPDQTANLLNALRSYEDGNPFFVQYNPLVMTPFLPVAEDVRSRFKKLQKVLKIEYRCNDYGVRLPTTYKVRRPFTDEELSWIMSAVRALSLPILVASHFEQNHFGIFIYDHIVTMNKPAYVRGLKPLLFFAAGNLHYHEELRTGGSHNQKMATYKRFIEQLKPDEGYEQVRAFYGFTPFPQDVSQLPSYATAEHFCLP